MRLLAQASLTHPVLKTTDRLAWAVEEALHRGTDGREYLVPTADDDVWWISIGWGSVVAELTYSIDPLTADGFAVLDLTKRLDLVDWDARVERVDRAPTSSAWIGATGGGRVVPAVSVERLGEILSGLFTSSRTATELVHDPGWLLHRHPLHNSLISRDPASGEKR